MSDKTGLTGLRGLKLLREFVGKSVISKAPMPIGAREIWISPPLRWLSEEVEMTDRLFILG
jgi:hypothetical protein